MNAHPFRAAVESGELGDIGRLFADDAVLNSPIAHRPYRGPGTIAAVIGAVGEVLDDFRFEKELPGGPDHVLLFGATVDGMRIQGCDFVHTRDDGLIDEITVMVRPLKAAVVFAQKVRAALETVG